MTGLAFRRKPSGTGSASFGFFEIDRLSGSAAAWSGAVAPLGDQGGVEKSPLEGSVVGVPPALCDGLRILGEKPRFEWSPGGRYAMISHDLARLFAEHREIVMPIAVTVALFVFWIFMAYRAFERGDVIMAGVLFLVGIVLTVYRYSAAQKVAKAKSQSNAS